MLQLPFILNAELLFMDVIKKEARPCAMLL